ncbi:uncharacterized protein EI90DRAFT_3108055 [Cantharellus anzutake]|uniref:uncharacterized protein n=1 Tax=Cantharellus anzutake TaxID=1750568 RepID=UPI0019070153|nr:uncharacterized protein EI90DRAFT_3108055 [Cantharellus anzutake]KAF8308725.1 hypothetical protein EI90DRAFT_3108055 [Cantharellus anzutake]
MSIFEDGPEDRVCLAKVTLKDIHAAIPKHLWKKSILKGIAWTLRDVALCTAFYQVNSYKSTGSMERDENYVPKTRSELKMADEKTMKRKDYAEIFEETPLWTLTRMVIMQTIGWNLYLTYNTLGSPVYPEGTNHWFPSSPLPKYYFIPYIWTNHWIVMDTWTFLRGAATTIDRPLMGWQGRFFLHNISHDHVAHHFFSSIPFWNGPELTKHVRKALGDDYNSDSTNTWRALYRSFVNCEFVEDEGDIIMWKNRQGEQLRRVAADPTGASDE